MKTRAVKMQKNKNQSVPDSSSTIQSGVESSFQFKDNRSETAGGRELQTLADNSSQVQQTTQLRTLADNYSSQQQSIKAENYTGLPDDLKAGIENLSGYSMDDVKIHRNSSKPAQLQAHAYTQGTDIHLGPGQEKHLPHEAWHVVQQKQGRVKSNRQLRGQININDESTLEKEADVMGVKALNTSVTASTEHPLFTHTASSLANSPIQARWAPAATFALNGGGNYTVEASDNFDSMDDPVWAHNAVANVAPVAAPAAGTPAYVANVISTARGKDKNATQVAAQYAAEAFNGVADAQRRFALVYLANREEVPYQPPVMQTINIMGRSTLQAPGIPNFPATAGYAFWRRGWRIPAPAPAPAAAPVPAVPTPQTTAQVYAQFQNAANPVAARNALQTTMRAAGFPTPRVPAEARQKVKDAPQTAAYIAALRGNGYTPFVHVGDADAVNMNVSPDGVAPAQPLFDRFDATIGANANAEVITGGYRFQERPALAVAAPPHSAGADLGGQDLMARTRQAVSTSELDQKVRGAMARVHPGLPYYPEPNLLVRGDLYERPEPRFSGRSPEWENLLNGISRRKADLWYNRLGGVQGQNNGINYTFFPPAQEANLPNSISAQISSRGYYIGIQRDENWIKARLRNAWLAQHGAGSFVFDPTSALVTDVGRFDQSYVDSSGVGANLSGMNYLGGETDPLALFDNRRAQQSHAKIGAIVRRIKNLYDLSGNEENWLGSVAEALLPQALWQDLSAGGAPATLTARTAASVAKLNQLQPYLGFFNNFADAVAQMIQVPAALDARVNVEVNNRFGRPAAHAVAAGEVTIADGRRAVRYLLGSDLTVDFRLIGVLGDPEVDRIYQAAKAPNRVIGPNLTTIINLVRDIGKEISAFLATYAPPPVPPVAPPAGRTRSNSLP